MTVTIDVDNNDLEFAQKGFLLPVENPIIPSSTDSSVTVWNCDAYAFLQQDCPDTANKLLWRQGQLCTVTPGLYQVVDGIYQVRGLDLANMTIIRVPGTNNVIIVDCLTCVETATTAIGLYQQQHNNDFGQDATIVALFYTHCHVDHFGGAQGVLDLAGTDIPIIGPNGFLEHAVSENLYAGPAMARRSVYMYGQSLDPSPTGLIGCGLGQAAATGQVTLVAPTHNIRIDGPLEHPIDGLEIICQLTPGTEAPAEVNFFFPYYSAVCMAENATHTLHNIQTLRGAPVRDARLWSRYLDEAIAFFGDKVVVAFASHHWPTWKQDTAGNDDLIVTFLSQQRDYYAYLHNESLRLLNTGLTPVEVSEQIQMPPSLSTKTNLQGYYGSISHNTKAVYDKYMGWFDGNPANLWPHKPTDEAIRFVACMGGGASTLQKASEYYKQGDPRFAVTLLNKLIFAEPNNGPAKQLLAEVYTQLGQGAENGTWRNIYLCGAQELLQGTTPSTSIAPSALDSLNLDELFDMIAIVIEGPKACLQKGVTIDFMIEDMLPKAPNPGVGWHLRLSNGAVTGHSIPFVANSSTYSGAATLTIWLTHTELATLVAKASTSQTASLDGLTTSGDTTAWTTITSLVVVPDTMFNIVTP